jgi:hypothetical protein
MSNYEQIEYTIPNHYICAILYGDISGLSDAEIERLDVFLDEVVETYGHAHFSCGEDLGFCRSNDIDRYAGDCTEGILLVETKK